MVVVNVSARVADIASDGVNDYGQSDILFTVQGNRLYINATEIITGKKINKYALTVNGTYYTSSALAK